MPASYIPVLHECGVCARTAQPDWEAAVLRSLDYVLEHCGLLACPRLWTCSFGGPFITDRCGLAGLPLHGSEWVCRVQHNYPNDFAMSWHWDLKHNIMLGLLMSHRQV